MLTIKANLDIVERGHNIHLPSSSGFRVFFCAEPTCGPHFVLLDKDGKAFVEMVLSPAQLIAVESDMLDHQIKLKEGL